MAMTDIPRQTLESSSTIRRRKLLASLGALGVGVAILPILPAWARSNGQATYFTWSGYDIPEMQTHYKAKYGANPHWPVFSDSQHGLQSLRAGFVADVVHPCAEDVPRWLEAGVIQPIDVSRLKNWPDLHPLLRALPAGIHRGKHYFVPWDWGVTSITYRTDLVKLPDGQESWGILWDQRNKGKISITDWQQDSWWCAAIYAGVRFDKLDEAAFAKVAALLKSLRPNIRIFTSDATAEEQALLSSEVVAAITAADAARALQKQGVPVKFARPKEGALNWACGMVLSTNAPYIHKAYDLIDGMLEPDIGAYCIANFGYGHSNVKSFARVKDADLAAAELTRDPTAILQDGHFAVPVSAAMLARIKRDKIAAGF
jgi:spermidine/putrescine transport system substrate-binding protein